MKSNNINKEADYLSQMLRQIPLETPSKDFTMNIMYQIAPDVVLEKTPFYKKPLFIGIISMLLGGLFLIFYNADFSWTVLISQIVTLSETIREFFPLVRLTNRQMDLSPTIVAPIVVIAVIFLIDRIIAAQKRNKEQRTYIL
ncbi:MAG: hypothetical protein LBH92_06750 [Bacteroidales bacterium]|jgi:hypothetical protein|nr:hypothetical protein [Bacteroidales bacterium]